MVSVVGKHNLEIRQLIVHSNHANWFASFKSLCHFHVASHDHPFKLGACLMFFSLARHGSRLFQLGDTCVSPFSIPGSNTASCYKYVVEMGDQFLTGLFDRMLKGVVEKSRDSSR